MKQNPRVLVLPVFFVFSILCLGFGPLAHAEEFSETEDPTAEDLQPEPESAPPQDPLLKIEASLDQNSVKSGMMFLAHVQAENTSGDTSVDFWCNSCSYEKHWVTDNAGVFIQSWTCNENTFEEVTLDPGESYSKNIILYIPKKDGSAPVTFRLGFKRMSENGDVAEPIWSDPVTMNVLVPDEMKEITTPAPVQNPERIADPVLAAATPPAEVPTAPAASTEPSAVSAPGTAEVPGNRPLVFEDPGVPIRIPPGQEFLIVLASNPSTGFRWEMTLPEGQKIIEFLSSEHIVSQEVMPGVPGEEVYKFKAATLGETKAEFVYERPWEPKTAPTRKIFTILVQEN